jgi:1,4-dihydroxy-2-naphthoate octaprenyltransferase
VDWVLYSPAGWVSLLQLGAHFLNKYYDGPVDANNPNRTPFSGGSGHWTRPAATERRPYRGRNLPDFVASLTVVLISQTALPPAALLIMVIAFLGAFFYSAPPIRLASSGYGELTTSILVANLVPAFAFILQTGDLHRLISMSTFPLTALHLSMMLAYELPDYGSDLRYEKKTLMVRMGWQSGMLIHNLLILASYLLLGLAMVYGLPLPIALPGFFTLPLGLFQIWQMRRIADGRPPNWTALTLGSAMLFALTAYLLAFSFWTR